MRTADQSPERMWNINDSLLSVGFCGKTSIFRHHRKVMPRKRDPSVFTTSVSGISDDAWDVFRGQVRSLQRHIPSYTLRQALQQSIFSIKVAIEHRDEYGTQFMIHPLPEGESRPVSIQIEKRFHDDLHYCSKLTGYKHNVILLNGMIMTALSINALSAEHNYQKEMKTFSDMIAEGTPMMDGDKIMTPLEVKDYLRQMYNSLKEDNIKDIYLRMTGKPPPNPSSSGYGYLSHGIKSA